MNAPGTPIKNSPVPVNTDELATFANDATAHPRCAFDMSLNNFVASSRTSFGNNARIAFK